MSDHKAEQARDRIQHGQSDQLVGKEEKHDKAQQEPAGTTKAEASQPTES